MATEGLMVIEGVRTKKLTPIPDERGRLMELLRSDWEDFFIKFGQVYLTTAYPGVVKAWHYHKKQIDNIVCIKGMIKLVLYDARESSPTYKYLMELFIGEHNYQIVQIPPNVYHGFKCISPEEAIVINIPTETYDYTSPDEYRVAPYDKTIGYDWARKDR